MFDQALDGDLSFRTHDEIDGLRFADADRRPHEPAGDREFIEVLRQLVDRRESDGRRRPKHERHRHLLAARLVL